MIGFNPFGIQQDGIYTEGRGADFSVDIVMESKGVIEDWGGRLKPRSRSNHFATRPEKARNGDLTSLVTSTGLMTSLMNGYLTIGTFRVSLSSTGE